MGRHKYALGARRERFARASGPAARDASPPRPATTGEGILDAAKNVAKRAGMKAANKLARESGRKVGKEIVARTALRPSSKTANDWGMRENAGDRIREILKANSLKAQPPRKESSPAGSEARHLRLGPQPNAPLGYDPGASDKANEVISGLMADDD